MANAYVNVYRPGIKVSVILSKKNKKKYISLVLIFEGPYSDGPCRVYDPPHR